MPIVQGSKVSCSKIVRTGAGLGSGDPDGVGSYEVEGLADGQGPVVARQPWA